MQITTTEHGLTITTERGAEFHADNDLGYLMMTSSAFLGAILRDEVDVKELAARMLADRGHDENGAWIGFAAAEARLLGAHHATAYNAQGKRVRIAVPID